MTTAVVELPSGGRQPSKLERCLLERFPADESCWPEWLRQQRHEARAWITRHGMTKPRDDAWRNAPLVDVLQQRPAVAKSIGTSAVARWPDVTMQETGPVLWFINGEPLTDAAEVAGVRWLALSKAIEQEPTVREQLGRHVQLENGFIAANSAGFSDGWCLIVEPGAVVECPIEIRSLSLADEDATLALPRLLVIAGASSHLRLVERHYSRTTVPVVSCDVAEIILVADAKVEHHRWLDHGANTWELAATAVSVGEGAEYHGWSGTARGRFVRQDLTVRLAGRHATAVLDGLYYARRGQLVAQHVRVWHEQPEGVTRECYRGVIEDEGRGAFDGIIYVGQGASKTDARQENRNLLLGPTAVAHTKPHLEIDNDDVSCSHGATVGQLDEQQLFYLRSRGVAEDEARSVLTWAFAKEIVDRCPSGSLRRVVEETLEAREARQ